MRSPAARRRHAGWQSANHPYIDPMTASSGRRRAARVDDSAVERGGQLASLTVQKRTRNNFDVHFAAGSLSVEPSPPKGRQSSSAREKHATLKHTDERRAPRRNSSLPHGRRVPARDPGSGPDRPGHRSRSGMALAPSPAPEALATPSRRAPQ